MDLILAVAAITALVFFGVRWRLREASCFDETNLRAGEASQPHPSDAAAHALAGAAWIRVGGSGF